MTLRELIQAIEKFNTEMVTVFSDIGNRFMEIEVGVIFFWIVAIAVWLFIMRMGDKIAKSRRKNHFKPPKKLDAIVYDFIQRKRQSEKWMGNFFYFLLIVALYIMPIAIGFIYKNPLYTIS